MFAQSLHSAYLTHYMPVLPSYRNQSIELICSANQLTGFYMRATLAFNGLINLMQVSFRLLVWPVWLIWHNLHLFLHVS